MSDWDISSIVGNALVNAIWGEKMGFKYMRLIRVFLKKVTTPHKVLKINVLRVVTDKMSTLPQIEKATNWHEKTSEIGKSLV